MNRSRIRKATFGGYQFIDNENRVSFLKLIIEDKMTVTDAAKSIGIKYSTAKSIKRIFDLEKRMTRKDNFRRSLKTIRERNFKRKKIFKVFHSKCLSKETKWKNNNEEKILTNSLESTKNLTNFSNNSENPSNTSSPIIKSQENTQFMNEDVEKIKSLFQFFELYSKKRILDMKITRNEIIMENYKSLISLSQGKFDELHVESLYNNLNSSIYFRK